MLVAWTDIVDRVAGVSAVEAVALATAARHARAHSLTSTADHSDVSADTPTEGQVLVCTSGVWTPRTIVAVQDGGTY